MPRNAHILARNLEPIFGARKDLQPLRNLRAYVAQQDAERFFRPATHPAAQLVKLR